MITFGTWFQLGLRETERDKSIWDPVLFSISLCGCWRPPAIWRTVSEEFNSALFAFRFLVLSITEGRVDVTFDYGDSRWDTGDLCTLKVVRWWSLSNGRFGHLLFKTGTMTARERPYFPRGHNLMRKLNSSATFEESIFRRARLAS